jgi:Flp pilus assembly protein TadD
MLPAAAFAHWPNDTDALNLRAVLACMAGRHTDGIALIGQVLAQRPDDIQAITTLGDALHAIGDTAGTVHSFEHSVKLAPHERLHSRLGRALLDAGRLQRPS